MLSTVSLDVATKSGAANLNLNAGFATFNRT